MYFLCLHARHKLFYTHKHTLSAHGVHTHTHTLSHPIVYTHTHTHTLFSAHSVHTHTHMHTLFSQSHVHMYSRLFPIHTQSRFLYPHTHTHTLTPSQVYAARQPVQLETSYPKARRVILRDVARTDRKYHYFSHKRNLRKVHRILHIYAMFHPGELLSHIINYEQICFLLPWSGY